GEEMKRLDSHQHFWRYSLADYPWIGPGMQALQRDFLPDDLEPLLQEVRIDSCISVQARPDVVETRWLLQLASNHRSIAGVVGWVDLCGGRAQEQLEVFYSHQLFCGVRHLVQDEPDDDFMLREDFQRGVSLLSAGGLVYDILIRPRHLPFALRFVDNFPDQLFVLDHLAKPPIATRDRTEWEKGFLALGKRDNVYCKLSGMVTEAGWSRWKVNDFRPYVDAALRAFGPRRLLFGSDWPVCTLAATYRQVVELADRLTSDLSPAERRQIWGENARRVYGVD
ncbi:MAG TPA: amidohydrolase family protein, partial [Acidobacteriota bacterium]|nr:amidohydrolase family protein [Acidobacteriota bacterium]